MVCVRCVCFVFKVTRIGIKCRVESAQLRLMWELKFGGRDDMSSTAVMAYDDEFGKGNGDEGEAGGGRKDIHDEGGVLGIG